MGEWRKFSLRLTPGARHFWDTPESVGAPVTSLGKNALTILSHTLTPREEGGLTEGGEILACALWPALTAWRCAIGCDFGCLERL